MQSFQDFFQLDTGAESRSNEGLFKVFRENFPISDSRENFVLEFIDYQRIYISTNIQLIELRQQFLNSVNNLNFSVGETVIEY